MRDVRVCTRRSERRRRWRRGRTGGRVDTEVRPGLTGSGWVQDTGGRTRLWHLDRSFCNKPRSGRREGALGLGRDLAGTLHQRRQKWLVRWRRLRTSQRKRKWSTRFAMRVDGG
uniref:Uncharacterized protein n=1 Tax=Hyaloperonospora arabidopsidis (strain Emoy2) TaxID=559515 RepID=M4C491_HYAAE